MLQFKKDSIEELEDIYKNLKIDPKEQNFFQAASSVLKKFIQLPQNALIAITWIGLKEWQENNKVTISDIESMRLDKQMKITKDLYDIRKNCMEKILIDPKKAAKILEKKVNKAFKHHLDLFHQLIKQAKKDGIRFF